MANRRTAGKNYVLIKIPAIAIVISGIIGTVYGVSKLIDNHNEKEPTSIVTTAPDISNNDSFVEESTTDFNNITDETELKNLIDQILAVEFQPTDTYFQNYDTVNSVSDELNALNKTDEAETSEEVSYDWYKNGVIDSDKLYEKIISNSKASGIKITTNVEEITKAFTKEVQGCLDYIKNKAPNYNSKTPLKNIDTITIDDASSDKTYMANYYPNQNHIEIDYLYSIDKNLLTYNILYTTFQALENQNNNLLFDIFTQRFTEDSIMDYGNTNVDNYKDDGYKVEMLAAATGKTYEELSEFYLESNIKSIIDAFEPEIPDEEVLLTLKFLDLACGHGNIPSGCNKTAFLNNASAKAKMGLLKNIYIREIKDVLKDGKSIDDAKNEITEFKKKILNDKYSPLSMDSQTEEQLEKNIYELDTIFFDMKYSK